MALGVDPNSGNKNFWQLYARDPKVRQGAQQKYEIGGQSFGGQGTTSPAGFQANAGGFDWHSLNKFDYNLTGATKPSTEIASTSIAGSNGSEGNFFTTGIGQQPQDGVQAIKRGGELAKFEQHDRAINHPESRDDKTGRNIYLLG